MTQSSRNAGVNTERSGSRLLCPIENHYKNRAKVLIIVLFLALRRANFLPIEELEPMSPGQLSRRVFLPLREKWHKEGALLIDTRRQMADVLQNQYLRLLHFVSFINTIIRQYHNDLHLLFPMKV